MDFKYNDGGKAEAGIKATRDCVLRAICIASGKDYESIHEELWALMKPHRGEEQA